MKKRLELWETLKDLPMLISFFFVALMATLFFPSPGNNKEEV